jgi:hypothetical protein
VNTLARASGWRQSNPAEAARIAALRGHLDFAAALLEEHDGWKKWSVTRDVMAEEAARYGRADLLEKLLDRCGPRTLRPVSHRGVLSCALQADTKTLQLLLEHGVSARGDFEGTTALHAAAQRGAVEAVRQLLIHDASVDATDLDRRTPLMLAARNGHDDVVGLLLKAGASADSVDVSEMRPLHFAVLAGNDKIVRMLLERGATTDARDARDRTALDLALQIRAASCTDVLTAANGTFSPRSPTTIEGILALDRPELLEKARSAGWDPAAPLVDTWTPMAVARQTGAAASLVWLRQNGASTSSGPKPATQVDSGPALVVPPVTEWFAGRLASRTSAREIRVVCTIDTDGQAKFPRFDPTLAPDLAPAVYSNVASWRGQPARVGEIAVPLLAALRCTVPVADSRIYETFEVDDAPVRVSGEDLNTRINRTMSVVGYDRREVAMRTINGRVVETAVVSTPIVQDELAGDSREDLLASLIVEPDGTVSHIAVLARATAITEPERLLMGWRFRPGFLAGAPVRTRVVLRASSNPSS